MTGLATAGDVGLLAAINVATGALRSNIVLVVQNAVHFQMGARLFHHLVRLPLGFFEKRHIGDVLSRFQSIEPIRNVLAEGLILAAIDGLMAVATLAIGAFVTGYLGNQIEDYVRQHYSHIPLRFLVQHEMRGQADAARVRELEQQKERLNTYQLQARFALATIFTESGGTGCAAAWPANTRARPAARAAPWMALTTSVPGTPMALPGITSVMTALIAVPAWFATVDACAGLPGAATCGGMAAASNACSAATGASASDCQRTRSMRSSATPTLRR